ncbi:MAG: Mfa1 family fimbria major subunit [Bacteroides sp.]
MKTTSSLLSYLRIVSLALWLCLSGCSPEALPPSPAGEARVQATLTLTLTMGGLPFTRTPVEQQQGTTTEDAVNRLTLFIVGSNNANNLTKVSVEKAELTNLNYVTVKVVTTEGDKVIYVAANMTDEQINSVTTVTPSSPEMNISKITDLTNAATGFLMTGKAKSSDGTGSISIAAGKKVYIGVDLKRVMSKVLLTVTPIASDATHAVVDDGSGYIQLANIHYVLNTTNKKFFLFEQAEQADPNPNLTSGIDTDFFCGATDADVQAGTVAISKGGEALYTDGLYCLENTLNTESANLVEIKKVMTYLRIAVKFTPKYIDSATDALTEDAASQQLTYGTFYTYKKAEGEQVKRCFSSANAGVTYYKSTLSKTVPVSDFIEHTGGWIYYETFVDSPTVFSSTNSVLRRNTYYQVNIGSFSAPLKANTMKVSTAIQPWTLKGQTNIDIDTAN